MQNKYQRFVVCVHLDMCWCGDRPHAYIFDTVRKIKVEKFDLDDPRVSEICADMNSIQAGKRNCSH